MAFKARKWTPKLAVARSKRALQAAINKLRQAETEWYDVDQIYVDEFDRLANELEEFGKRIENEVKERLECGEHIGL